MAFEQCRCNTLAHTSSHHCFYDLTGQFIGSHCASTWQAAAFLIVSFGANGMLHRRRGTCLKAMHKGFVDGIGSRKGLPGNSYTRALDLWAVHGRGRFPIIGEMRLH
jgi:hypothetical protein